MKTNLPMTTGEDAPVIVTEVQTKHGELRQIATNTEIVDANTLNFVVESGSVAARLIKALEVERKLRVDPLNEQVKAINSFFKQFSDPLSSLKEIFSKKITDYKREEERKAEEERRRIQAVLDEQRRKELEEAERTGKPAPSVALEVSAETVQNTVTSETGSASGRKRWTYRVLDEKAVPREFTCLDSKKINEAIRGGVREIKGLEIYQEETAVFK